MKGFQSALQTFVGITENSGIFIGCTGTQTSPGGPHYEGGSRSREKNKTLNSVYSVIFNYFLLCQEQ